jgi:hypothetical protein
VKKDVKRKKGGMNHELVDFNRGNYFSRRLGHDGDVLPLGLDRAPAREEAPRGLCPHGHGQEMRTDHIEKEVLHLFYLHRGKPESALQESVIRLVQLLLENQRSEILQFIQKFAPDATPERIVTGIRRSLK